MIDDIFINKAAIIRRCLARISEEIGSDPSRMENFTVQDSVILNLLRACEAAIDLAMHTVAELRLGVPQSSRDAFSLLAKSGLISHGCSTAMQRMTGFRNVAVHDYQDVELPVLDAILRNNLPDFDTFLRELEARGSGMDEG